MAQNSKIEWCDTTWNVLAGCDKVSDGCKNCYAMQQSHIRAGNPNLKVKAAYEGTTMKPEGGRVNWTGKINLLPNRLEQPLHWKKPRKVFVNAMSDLFHEDVPFEFIDRVFAVMHKAEKHTFQILTKRPERALQYILMAMYDEDCNYGGFYDQLDRYGIPDATPMPNNIWLGVSVEDQKTADERIPLLLQIPAKVRFLSCEPLLGEVDLKLPVKVWVDSDGDKRCDHCCNKDRCDEHGHYYRPQCPYCRGTGKGKLLDWVICGGESGHKGRPMHPGWARKLRDDCKAAGVPYFFKQWGEWVSARAFKFSERRKMKHLAVGINGENLKITEETYRDITPETHSVMVKAGKKAAGRLLDGVVHNEYPVRQK